MKRKLWSLAIPMVMMAGLSACSANNSAPAAETAAKAAVTTEAAAAGQSAAESAAGMEGDYTEIIMKFGTSSAESTLTAKTFMEWGERLSQKTDGKVKVDVYCSSVLGNNSEMVQGAQLGTVDIAVIQPGGIADMGATKMNLLTLPYLFNSYDQYYKTLTGPVGEQLLQDVTDHVSGLVGFGYLPDGGRDYFTTSKPIRTIEDIKGQKLRVQPYEIDGDTASALGFSATPVAFSELYSALQTGVVDGAENPIAGIDGSALYEVSSYLTLDNHTYNIPVLLVSRKTWDKISDDTKTLMETEWLLVVDEYYVPQLSAYEAELLKKFEAHGVEVIPAVADPEKWVEAVQPVWDKYGVGIEDLIQEVQNLK